MQDQLTEDEIRRVRALLELEPDLDAIKGEARKIRRLLILANQAPVVDELVQHVDKLRELLKLAEHVELLAEQAADEKAWSRVRKQIRRWMLYFTSFTAAVAIFFDQLKVFFLMVGKWLAK